MGGSLNWIRYVSQRLEYAVSLSVKGYWEGKITMKQVSDVILRNALQGKLTYIHKHKGEEMAPMIENGSTLLVRQIVKIPQVDSWGVLTGDVVVLKDPADSDNYLVRRLAAVEGDRMSSTDETEEPFNLENDQCWVLGDKDIKSEEEPNDSRTFGPVSMSSIVGRAIYVMRNAVDHGPINNSEQSVLKDAPVLEVELDVEELITSHGD